jgi:dihydroneopterin aldolase
MYKIKLNNMRFKSHIGVLPEEKKLGQNIEVDLIIETNFDFSGKDELDQTLSYVDFFEATKTVIENSRDDLIETLAFDIIQKVKTTSDRIATVECHLRKYAVPIDGIFDSAEIEMRG